MEYVVGEASVRRIGAFGFPTSALMLEDESTERELLANLGRGGWFRVFFGRGRRIELPDGTNWRLTAVENGSCVEPMVVCDSGRLAVGTARGNRSYGVNGRDFAYVLFPANNAALFKSTWVLREHDTPLATVGASFIRADHPVPLAAALLCFALVKHGVPGDADLGIPEFQWG